MLDTNFNGQEVSFVVQMPSGGNDVWFASKENNQYSKPTLKIKTDEALSVNDISLETIKIFPNPVKNKLFVSKSSSNQLIQVYDLIGRLKTSKQLNVGENTIDFSVLPSGFYFVKVKDLSTSKSTTKSFKVIKE